jgi:hypothetical protein
MIACREMRLWFQHRRLRPARRAGPTTDTRCQTHSRVGAGVVATCRHRHLAEDKDTKPVGA